MTLQAKGQVIPTGGCTVLTVSGITAGPLVWWRAIGAEPYVQIGSSAQPGGYSVIVDYGEGLQGPLPNNQGAYSYLVTDSVASAFVSGLTPVISLEVNNDWLDETVMRCVQAGIANLVLPTGYQDPSVLFEMPRTGFPALPFIYITPMTMQQTDTQIGQDVPQALQTPGRFLATLSTFVTRTWRQSIYCRTAGEREFYRDAVLGIWQSLLASVFQPLGSDMHHSFLVHSGQEATKDFNPGFYSADILFQVEGLFNVGLIPTYGLIETIHTVVTGSLGNSTISGFSISGPSGTILDTVITSGSP